MKRFISKPGRAFLPILIGLLTLLSATSTARDFLSASDSLIAKSYNTGFEPGGTSWNSISTASDGKIYYALSTTDIDQGAQFYSYDPETDKIETLADLTEVSGGGNMKMVPQGKSHGNFYEYGGKLYISTHVGVHGSIEKGELAITQEGYKPYPGGHFLSYDLSSGQFEDLATAPDGEGILSMTMDQERGQIYGITWPKGYFIHYNVHSGELKNIGLVSGRGEAGTPGEDFRVLCRALVVDPEDGTVYYSTAVGDIFAYNPDSGSLDKLEGVDLRLDYFGENDGTRPGSFGYNWRQIIWSPSDEVAYGVHGNSGYLFRFDPRQPKIEIVERITSEPSKKSGMNDQDEYGYLGFDLAPDGETLYYLTGGPIYKDGQRITKDNSEEMGLNATENVHLVTYNLSNKKYTDHGPVVHENGSRVTGAQSIAIAPDGVYTLAGFERDDNRVVDLVKIPNPFEL